MEPWEALDLDYSDVRSLLRPLKRHRSPQPPSAASAASAPSTLSLPLLESCSRPLSQSQSQSDNHQSESNFSSQSPISRSQRISSELEAPCPSSASSRLIPGPAGAVQAAMQRRTRGDNCFHGGDEEPVPTQEFIRRVIENGDEEDDDFNGHLWLCALDFVRGLGAMEGNGIVSETPLDSIKNGFDAEKVALVVAIIKSCTSNGLGGMMVTLKDPTGTIDASIHHRVISKGKFGKDLSVGAVLILQKVTVFSPTRFVHVLNVTSSNVIKVISKDSGSSTEHNNPTEIRQPDSITRETQGDSYMLENNFDVPRETTQSIMNNLRQNSNLRESGPSDSQIDKGNVASYSNCKGNGNDRNQQIVVGKDGAMMDLGMSKGTSSFGCNTLLVDRDRDQETEPDKHINNCMGTDTGELSQVPNIQEAETVNEMKKTEKRAQGSLLPQWTDEQLDELFVFD